MTHELRPVDLSAPRLEACRWAVVWWVDNQRQEAILRERALADAYAFKQHGIVVALTNLSPWPTEPR